MPRNGGLLISVIIPVWNGAVYLAETLDSVKRQGVATEIVVADDGSTDKSREIATEKGCRVLSLERGGISRACNAGIARAAGRYIMLLDQDDVLCDACLAPLRDALEQDESLGAVTGKARDFISPELDERARAEIALRPAPYYGLMTGSVLMHRSVPGLAGGFNEAYHAGQAVDYLMRMAQCGILCKKLDMVSVMRRIHAQNTSRTMRNRQFSDYGAILRARLAAGKRNA
ncbi:MAG: glycosyltransferase [Desulfovibrio sp.]|uniref:glycosyltransferase family 2 protein n=1 Tax=Desulfovibrio sp. TaxID=885 RepID=UPI0025851257|nr:glycosyltransferase family 2 protein [Desulfovibrio sp.]MCD7985118.1 glycosyltransferase [Desulfovibrio sp.]